VERLFEEYYFNVKEIYKIPNTTGGMNVLVEGMKFISKEKDENVSDV